MMKSFGLLALAASAKLVSGHATIFAAWINDVDQGLGNIAGGYIRAPPNNSPIVDVTSKDMICNVNNAPVAKTLEVAAGDKFSFEWHHNTRDSSDDIIDPSHRGPVLVYIAPTTEGTAGNGWVKIYEDGFDGSSWAVDKLRAARGIHSITIPDIAAGDYLLRAEIIALHEGDRLNGAQFYPGCVQIKITSSGSTTLPAGSTIPGIYKATDPGVLFDLYNGFTSYPIPGPALWDGVSGGSSSAPAPTSTAEPTTTSAAAPAPTTAVPTAPASSVPTTLQTSVRSSTTSVPTAVPTTPTTTPPSSSGSVAVWYQCGGINYVGATTCESGLVCKDWNPYYYQCIPA